MHGHVEEGAGAAAEEARTNANATRLEALRNRLEAQVGNLDVAIIGAEALRLPNTSCIAVAGKSSETLVMALDLAGFAVSAGSACSDCSPTARAGARPPS